MKIGILGGTFNPIHNGHLILAQNALDDFKLDKVLIMPSCISYFKNPDEIVSVSDRINMVKCAIMDNPGFELSTIETDRGGNSYTYETILALKAIEAENELYYIIGADTLLSMETWKKPGLIFNNCKIICAKRDNISDEILNNKKNELLKLYDTEIFFLKASEVAISSSMIRDFLQAGYSARYYMPESVRQYIIDHDLYKRLKITHQL